MLDLVDNKDFINWSTTYGGPEDEDVEVILLEPVASLFLTVAGAEPLTTVNELVPALNTLF